MNKTSRKLVSSAAMAALLISGIVQANADSTRTFGSAAFIGSTLPTALLVESSAVGDVIYVAEGNFGATSSGHGLFTWNGTDFEEELVPDTANIDGDVNTTSIQIGFSSMSLSDDGTKMLLANSGGGVSYKSGASWLELSGAQIFGSSPSATYLESGQAINVAISGNGNFGFLAATDNSNPDLTRLYGANLAADTIQWRYFGTAFDSLAGYQLMSNGDGTKLVVADANSASVVTLNPNTLGSESLEASFRMVTLDQPYPSVIVADISSNGQTIVLSDDSRQFVSLSKDGGASFASFDPVAVFGPGEPNRDFSSFFLGSAASISTDGSKIALLSGDYVGILTVATNVWDTVYAGGTFPVDATFLGSTELAIIAKNSSNVRGLIRTSLTSVDSGVVPISEQNGTVPAPTKMLLDSQVVRSSVDVDRLISNGTAAPFASSGSNLYSWSSGAWVAVDGDSTVEGIQAITADGAIVPGSDPGTFYRWHLTTATAGTMATQLSLIDTNAGTEAAVAGTNGAPTIPESGQEYLGPIARLGTKVFLATAHFSLEASYVKPIHIYDPAAGGSWTDTSAVTVDGTVDGTPVTGSWISLKAQGTDLWAATTQNIFKFNGSAWSEVALPAALNGAKITSFDVGTGVIAVTGGDFLNRFGYFSKNAGTTWTKVEPGLAMTKAAISTDGSHLAFFNDYSASLSTNGGTSFTLIATTSAITKQALFYTDSVTRLMFQKEKPGDMNQQGGWKKVLDTSVASDALVAWDGSFGNAEEPGPTWGTTLWDKSSFYAPNMLFMSYGGNSAICVDGIGVGACPAPSSLSSQQQSELQISGDVYLDPCVDTAQTLDTFCIEGLKVKGPEGSLQTATLTTNAPTGGLSWAPQSFTLNYVEGNQAAIARPFSIRDSGQPSVWNAGAGAVHSGDSTLYSVNALLQFNYNLREGLVFRNYSATVLPVNMVTGTVEQYPDVEASASGGGVSWSGNMEQCAWNDAVEINGAPVGLCAEKQEFLAGSQVALTVRLPKEIAGWYKGRVLGPTISTQSLEDTPAGVARGLGASNFNSITVSGAPVLDLPAINDAQITLEETPLAYRGFAMSLLGQGGQIINDSDASTVKYINAIKDAASVADKANEKLSLWQFSTMDSFFDPCYDELVTAEGPGVIAGMVSTDAMAYSGRKPQVSNGELVYAVAGLHRKQNNDVAQAKYSLSIRADYARCSFDLADSVELNPTAEVTEKTTGEEKTGITTTFGTYDSAGVDWWRVDVSGITFSNPSIAVNLTGGTVAQAPTSGGAPAAVVSPVTTPPAAITPPVIPAGQSGAVLIGGVPAVVTISPNTSSKALEIKGTDWSLGLTPDSAGASPLNAKGELVLNPQGTTDLAGTGFQANSKASAFLIPRGATQVAALGITQANLRLLSTPVNLGAINVNARGAFSANLDLTSAKPGDYILQINGAAPDGKIRSISVAANVLDVALKGWTKKLTNNQAKVYVKNVVAGGKVQIFVNGREIAWVNAVDQTDPKLRKANGFNYLVRTINLVPGKNRVEIKVDGERERFTTYTR